MKIISWPNMIPKQGMGEIFDLMVFYILTSDGTILRIGHN